MDYIYFFAGFSVFGIFVLKPSLLISKGTFKIILAASAMVFVLGLILHFRKPEAGALLAALPTIGYFRICRAIFLKQVGREPIDVVYNWSPGLFKDRVFSITFFLGSLFIVMVTSLGMSRLSEMGW